MAGCLAGHAGGLAWAWVGGRGGAHAPANLATSHLQGMPLVLNSTHGMHPHTGHAPTSPRFNHASLHSPRPPPPPSPSVNAPMLCLLQVSWLYVLPAETYELLHNSALKVMRGLQTVAKFLLQVGGAGAGRVGACCWVGEWVGLGVCGCLGGAGWVDGEVAR